MTQSRRSIMTRLPFILWLILAASCTSGQPHRGTVEHIMVCLNELARHNSSNVIAGQLAKPWSVAWVIDYTEPHITFISIRHSMPDDIRDSGYITHDWAILCTVDVEGRVISLDSPEKDSLVQLVKDDGLAEDRAFGQLVENLHLGKTIYRTDSYYRISGTDIIQYGETKKTQVIASDFGVD